jgi:hypothetical protein
MDYQSLYVNYDYYNLVCLLFYTHYYYCFTYKDFAEYTDWKLVAGKQLETIACFVIARGSLNGKAILIEGLVGAGCKKLLQID